MATAAAPAAVPSLEELLSSIPGLHKAGAPEAPAAADAAVEPPAAKRRKGGGAKGAAKDAPAEQPEQPAGGAAPEAAAAVHSLSDTEAVATVDCPAGALHDARLP